MRRPRGKRKRRRSLRSRLSGETTNMRANLFPLVACALLSGCAISSYRNPVLTVPPPAPSPRLSVSSTQYIYSAAQFAGAILIQPGFEAALTSRLISTRGEPTEKDWPASAERWCAADNCLNAVIASLGRLCGGLPLKSDDLTLLYESRLEPVPPGSRNPCEDFQNQ